ncbi:nucleotidyltransferase domain-containing protein [Streptomyces olivochromogenes]|uniref:nucleotidyltransferase domain-containing protein n=1 Tax=Streptomyces olivochromogenes TaxID=1963 RepID=UPI00367870A5
MTRPPTDPSEAVQSDEQSHSRTTTLLIAGHDTTAVALARALHQLELPLAFADDGSAEQASPEPERPFTYPSPCFVTGTIHGMSVPPARATVPSPSRCAPTG